MGWVRTLGVEVAFFALLLAAAGALLGSVPRLAPEGVRLLVLYLSQLAVLGSVTFLLLRSRLGGWWLAAAGVVALAGGWGGAGLASIVLGVFSLGMAKTFTLEAVLGATGVVGMVALAGRWRRSSLRLRWADFAGIIGRAGGLAGAYALGYLTVGSALAAAGAFPHEIAPLTPAFFAAGLARGALMLACVTPLVLTLLGRRSKNAFGVGVLLAVVGGVMPRLVGARLITGEVMMAAGAEALLCFALGAGYVRLVRPPLSAQAPSWEQPAVHEKENPEATPE